MRDVERHYWCVFMVVHRAHYKRDRNASGNRSERLHSFGAFGHVEDLIKSHIDEKACCQREGVMKAARVKFAHDRVGNDRA